MAEFLVFQSLFPCLFCQFCLILCKISSQLQQWKLTGIYFDLKISQTLSHLTARVPLQEDVVHTLSDTRGAQASEHRAEQAGKEGCCACFTPLCWLQWVEGELYALVSWGEPFTFQKIWIIEVWSNLKKSVLKALVDTMVIMLMDYWKKLSFSPPHTTNSAFSSPRQGKKLVSSLSPATVTYGSTLLI